MSEKTYGTIVTNKGIDLIANATLEQTKVNITELAVGDGNGAYYQPTPDMLELKKENWRGPVGSVKISEQSPNMIDIIAVIPSSVGGWTIREMAVFDDLGNMIAICNTPDTEKVIITSGAAGEIELTMHIEISNTDNITFVIDPNVITATKKDIQDHNESPTAHKNLFDKKADKVDVNNHINNTEIHVNAETMANYNTAIAELIAHTEDETRHVTAEDKAKWNTGEDNAAEALSLSQQAANKLNELSSRMAQVEDGLFSNITGNPFNILFSDIDGIEVVKGIWNKQKQRIEC